jgi:hypothetical protein
MPVLAINLCEVVLKTLFYKNYFSIFFTPSIRFPSCKEVHPPKVFFGKTVWRRRKEPYIYFKTHPRSNRAAPPILFTHKDLSEAPAAVTISHLPPLYYSWRGIAAGSRRGFLVLHTVCSENQLKC